MNIMNTIKAVLYSLIIGSSLAFLPTSLYTLPSTQFIDNLYYVVLNESLRRINIGNSAYFVIDETKFLTLSQDLITKNIINKKINKIDFFYRFSFDGESLSLSNEVRVMTIFKSNDLILKKYQRRLYVKEN